MTLRPAERAVVSNAHDRQFSSFSAEPKKFWTVWLLRGYPHVLVLANVSFGDLGMKKDKKKPNALKHGAYSGPVQMFMWGEDSADYEALRNGVYAEYPPDGPSEVHWVETLADLLWRRRRLDTFDSASTLKRLRKVVEHNLFCNSVEQIRSFAFDFPKARTLEEVDLIIKKVSSVTGFDFSMLVSLLWPLAPGADPEAWGPQIAKGILRFGPAETYKEEENFLQGFDLEAMDGHLARVERLDAQIEKTVKRLMQIKTMKQMNQALEPKPVISSVARLGAKNKPDQGQPLQ
jgi:hypothetical protein